MSNPASNATGGALGYFVRHRTAANLLLALMMIAGVYSFTNIRAQFFPDFIIETLTVRVAWPGAGAEDVDAGVVALMEPSLLTIEGVESLQSLSREGSASMVLSFEDGWDMARAAEEVKAAVDAVNNLPTEAEEPSITRRAFRDRVTYVNISGPVGLDLLARYADELNARLFKAGVARTSITGAADPLIRVSVPEQARRRHDLGLAEISNAIKAEISATPAGAIDASASRVRAGEERRSVEDIGAIALRSTPEGGKLYLRDVAHIEEEGADRGEVFFRNGQPAVQIQVDRDARGDSIALQKIVEEVAAQMRPTLPQGVTLQLSGTRAQYISDRLDILYRNGLGGLLFVLLFLFLFLSARTAFWVALGIPASIAATLGIMYAMGLTLNMVSMFALIISLGIIVDDAIVVGEHADYLARDKGHSPADAAALAARRMAGPVFAASITTIIAFSALMAIGGRFGSLIGAIPLTVGAVLIASLVESFLVLPAHMKHALAAKTRDPWYDAPSRAFNRGFAWFREKLFRPFITLAARLRYVVVAGAICLLMVTLALVISREVRFVFFSAPERGTVTGNVAMLPGAAREDTRAVLDEMDRALGVVAARYREEYGSEPVEFSLAKLGGNMGRGLSAAADKDADLLGGFQIELLDPDYRPWTQSDFLKDWRAEIEKHPMTETLAFRGMRSGPGGDAIYVEFSDAPPARLKEAAEALKQQLARFPAASALEDTLAYDKAELLLSLSEKGRALGFDASAVGAELRRRLSGVEAAQFARDSKSIKVMVSPPEEEIGADYLENAWLRAPGGGYAALQDIVDFDSRQGFASIRREDGVTLVAVSGDIADDPEAEAEIRDALESDILPAIAAQYGVSFDQGGLREQERGFFADAGTGFMLCLAGIYLTLCWIFGSWSRPLVVMLAIPFGLIGAIWGHYWWGVPLSMFSIVGLIGMSGIIINDSIVLMTTIDEYAERRRLFNAVVEGACDRLRAVLLTTITTVAGLAPLLFESSRQAQFLMPTVITLAFGLGFGVVLVLMVTPSLILIQNDIGRSLTSLRRFARHMVSPRRGLGGRRRLRRATVTAGAYTPQRVYEPPPAREAPTFDPERAAAE